MSTTIAKKEEKISHTTINTFSASVRKLYDKLAVKFTAQGLFICCVIHFVDS